MSDVPFSEVDEALARIRRGLFPQEAEITHHIGRFRVKGRLGAGGMGVVYGAHDPELDRAVAIKLVRSDAGPRGATLSDPQLHEARALARLAHPNVVGIYEIGIHEGNVFIAMELVEGQVLRRWLGAARSTADIIEVFRQAGDGLAAAHEAGLVHRDFKPDNVIVGDDGRVRVLDFGIAGLRPLALAQDPDEEGSSAPGAAGTPAYMAPEQRDTERVDARSDQYAFCVSLHEALTGERPGRDLDGVCRHHGRVPRRVERAIARGLARSPADRFPTMRELLSELAPTRSVSPRVVAVFALILAVGATTAALLHVRRDDRCEHVNDVVEATWNADRANELARELAGRSTWLAEDRARFLERLDPRFDTLRSERVETCRATHVRGEQSGELLDLRMRCLEQRRRELDSLVSAVTNDADLNGSWALAALEQLPALEICGDGEALARKRLPEPEDAQLREMVAALRDRLLDVESLFAAGRYEAALELLLELRPGASAYPPASAELELRHGRLLEKLGRPADAVFALGEGLTTAQAHGHDLLVAQLTTELAFVAVAVLSKPEEGERWLALAEASTSRLGGDPDLEARQRSVRAHLQWRRGQGAESRASYRAAHDLLAAAHGEDHPSALTEALNELVVSQTTAESRDLVEKLLALLVRLEDRVGANHPEVGRALGTLATTYVRQGRHVDAVATFERAIAAYSGAGQGRHLHASMLWRNLAVSLIELERWAEAETALDESLAIATAIDPEHPAVAGAIHNLGLLRFERGDPAGAREPLERALALKLEAGGPGHPSTAVTLYLLGRVELALGEEDPAIDHLSQARVIQQRVGDPELAVTLLWLGRALAQRGHPERLRARPGADP